MRHTYTYVYISVCKKGRVRKTLFNGLTPTSTLFQLTVAIIFEMDETGVPAKTTDLPHMTDKFYTYIYIYIFIYMIKSLVEFYNRNLFLKKNYLLHTL